MLDIGRWRCMQRMTDERLSYSDGAVLLSMPPNNSLERSRER